MRTYEIIQDQDAQNPRTEWDNLGTMVCFHRQYILGDRYHNYDTNDYSNWDELENAICKRENVAAILPLYLYDHGGITMNTTGFSCRWDSGQVGFIFISKAKALKEFGGKIVTKKLRERMEKYLKSEVETYDQYLRGDVYGIKIFEDGEEVDSVWGFYGYDYAEQEAKAMCEE
jgi:hypothetical protein